MRTSEFVLTLTLLLVATAASAPLELKLWPDGEGGEGAGGVSLFVHTPGSGEKEAGGERPAILVCPGGGYGSVVMSYEGHEIADWFAARGFVAFVLKYRVSPFLHPAPMRDVQRAMQFVRSSCSGYGVDPSRIGVIGFSAGGHLAATAGTRVVDARVDAEDPVLQVSSRPDFMVLAYPVISMIEGVSHLGSRKNLLGEEPGLELLEETSLERQVTGTAPPTFIFQTDEDPVVPAEHSVLFYLALRKAGVPAELHIYREGGHGAGLGRHESSSSWPGLLAAWLERSGIDLVEAD